MIERKVITIDKIIPTSFIEMKRFLLIQHTSKEGLVERSYKPFVTYLPIGYEIIKTPILI